MNISTNLAALLQNARQRAAGSAGNAGTAAPAAQTQVALNGFVGTGGMSTLQGDVRQFAKDVAGMVDPNQLQTVINSVDVGQFKSAIQNRDPAQFQSALQSVDKGAIRNIASSLDINQIRNLESFQKIQSTFKVASDKQIDAILQKRPLAPTDQNLFSPAAYPGAPPLEPAAGPKPTEKQAGKMLKEYMKDEFPMNPAERKQAEALFNSPDLIAKIPDPSLRAGLLGLKGTAGEPAIDFYLNGTTDAGLPKVTAVGFDANPWDPTDTGIARTLVDPNTQQMSVFVNPKYQNENPFQFSSILAHEALHSDVNAGASEEVNALAIQSSIYLEQLAKHPELAGMGTELTRRNNTNALARLNSGTGTELGLFASNNNQPILPGSPLGFKSWAEQFQNVDQSQATPGNPLLQQILGKMAEPGATVPPNADFSTNTLSFIDQNSGNLSNRELLAAANALKLNTQV